MAQTEPNHKRKLWWWRRCCCGGGDEGGSVTVDVAGDEYVTIVASTSMAPSLHESSLFVTATAGQSELQISAAIEKSKDQGWSELAKVGTGQVARAGSLNAADALIWEELKNKHPRLFRDNVKVKLGRVIAEGSQAHIHEVEVIQGVPTAPYSYVAKVFKMDDFSLAVFQRQWPMSISGRPTILLNGEPVFGERFNFCTNIEYGWFLEDGRFAFMMRRFWGDLRTLIDLRMENKNYEGPPFLYLEALKIMQHIALGIYGLHWRGAFHRDLRAANVLIQTRDGTFKQGDTIDVGVNCEAWVADYESSLLVVGTGFWRAPEVLKELQKPPPCVPNAMIWTEKVDVYSYAMTCYEILTGLIPFDGYYKSDWDKIIVHGERPNVPHYVNTKLKDLMERCWHGDPSKRPSFSTICEELVTMLTEAKVSIAYDQYVTTIASTSMVPYSHESSLDVIATAGESKLEINTVMEESEDQGSEELTKVGTGQVVGAGSLSAEDVFSSAASMSMAPSLHESSTLYVTADLSGVQIASVIEKSKDEGWSELAKVGTGSLSVEDALMWEELKKKHPSLFGDSVKLRLGRLIAEGGQARIYEAEVIEGALDAPYKYVAKVFEMDGFSLADLGSNWPFPTAGRPSILLNGEPVFGERFNFCISVDYGLFLEDGRFAILMQRCWGDLRKLIDLQFKNKNCEIESPFSYLETVKLMQHIALGIYGLHWRGVLHRDLKAANVLIRTYDSAFKESDTLNVGVNCEACVADFESSMLVQGTGFWRAPEVLKELQKPRSSDQNPRIWTTKVDVYSYAMTCYEILTGRIPFLGYVKSDRDKIIVHGERPHVPHYVNPKLRDLMERCWHGDPSKRPSFVDIHDELNTILNEDN